MRGGRRQWLGDVPVAAARPFPLSRRVCITVAGSLLCLTLPGRVGWAAESNGLREVGFMPASLQHTSANLANITEHVPPPMIVDAEHNLGFAVGFYRNADDSLAPGKWVGMYDLKSLKLLDRIDSEGWGSDDIFRFTLDSTGERLLEPMIPGNPDPSCANGPTISTIEYGSVGGKRKLRVGTPLPLPCPGLWRIVPSINAIYEDRTANPPRRKLYVYGTYPWEFFRGAVSPDLQDNDGQPLVIQQIDLAKLDSGAGAAALDWQFDLRYAGCGRIAVPFVQRVGDSVFSYCADARPAFAYSGSLSEQGYVVRIPLDEHDQPFVVGDARIPDPYDVAAPAATNFLVRRTPALAGTVVPFADPVAGTVLLLSNDSANGNATWVFDPLAERFVGVITGGEGDPPPHKNAAGFDGVRGRTYLFTSTGILMAPTRQRPLPTGTIYDVVSHPDDLARVPHIAVAPKLRRLFIPLAEDDKGKGRGGWAVVEDNVPEPPPHRRADPDRNTLQVAENAATRVESRGSAIASGAHLLVAGGITRALNTSDPACDEPVPDTQPVAERTYFDDRCIWEVLLASGHREMFFAEAAVEVGSTTGAIAEGSGLTFAEADHTDQDVKRAGECYQSGVEDVLRGGTKVAGGTGDETSALQDLYDLYGTACDAIQAAVVASGGPDLTSGTRGPDDQGFPVKQSDCAAFDEAETEEQPPDGVLQYSSAVSCDPAGTASADAASAAFAFPGLEGSVISFARTTSSVRSVRTERGQETIVEAVAHGVQIGPLQIGEVRTTATTRAKGRTGTAAAEIVRRWCRVRLAGEPPIDDCIDPASAETRALIDQVNQALGRVRISVPDVQKEASPGGYQAVVTKHPDVRAADEAVNDDDSHTVPGLQLVVYNDGIEGRNRLVLQLAGVHAESRYGIQAIPELTPSILDRLPGDPGGVLQPGADVPLFEQPSPPGSLVKRVLRSPAKALREAVRLLVNNPREFALLFLLLTIIAAPLYLTIRRRMFETEVSS